MKYLLCIPILLTIIACSNDGTSEIGNDWIDSETTFLSIDTLTVRAATLKFDSMVVSGERLLIGSYADPVFGRTNSESYFQLESPGYDIDNEAIFDSIALILKYDNYYYNDTISRQKFDVFEVVDNIKPSSDDYFYNTTTFNYNTSRIGTKIFDARPKGADSLHISIDAAFGNELFSKIQDNDITNIDEFLNEYRGLLVQPDTINNTAVLGFSNDSYLRIYYTIEDEEGNLEETWDFPISSTNSSNHISSSHEGTVLESLTDQEMILPSSETSNTAFMQSGVGVLTRIEFPYVKSLYTITGTGSIVEASLNISIKKNASTINLHTKDSLALYIMDANSDVVSDLLDYSGSAVYGTITEENSEFNITRYSIPIKTFLDTKLSETTNNDNLYLAIYAQDYYNSVDRYILYGENNSDQNKLKLELTYAIYNDN
ncbi:DUF4270 family protein [Ulvibacter litoralis]|uniref:DUF4270 domain-containing protein n=1 Tax=Ulvibacter litoralis TaxID=227084 RepID=A0A1G7CQ11_9FLAO|nr:DUF4270 family protein [Ulvibacter litoralis]GHC46804.1 hypothetical protein GCM10008083_07360 [Ulvibacter litoralis]SDE40585.1 protein of unknown function [Ulvibacter litoralis]